MKRMLIIVPVFTTLFFCLALQASEYIGSMACSQCHSEQYNSFITSGHPFKLSKAEDAMKRPIPLPEGYSWQDISYVIGGAYKKIRYVNKQGYIITAAKDGSELKTQYNMETDDWSFYHKGEQKPYTCGACHTTGFKPEGHQNDLKGIKGTWAAEGIQCEACHGPGSDHVKSPNSGNIVKDGSTSACGQCHVRGNVDKIPAKKGFIRHHEQLNEHLASPHKNFTCVTCHNPHKRAQFSIVTSCANCHKTLASMYKGSTMERVGVQCIDCHMPRATKSAVAKSKYEADIRTHLYRINTALNAEMFYTEKVKGKTSTFAKDFISLDFACLNCHKNKNRKWAASQIEDIHELGKD